MVCNGRMNEPTTPVVAPVASDSAGLIWKVLVAVILSPFCALIGFIGEVVGALGVVPSE
jgi:hypothetical protein